MKKNLLFKFFVLAVVAVFATMSSCKSYDDDIDNLQTQIDSMKKTLDEIQAKVNSGAVITNVASTSNGITITLSDGKSYTITNGTNGQDGAPGSVITIGENGHWLIDGVDTGVAAQGPAGLDGKDGAYYFPNEDGYWHKIAADGTDTKTEVKWQTLPEGTLTAVFADGQVTLYGVKMSDGSYGTYVLGKAILSHLTLIPDFVADWGGALPVLNFSPLTTPCGDIAPSAYARYKVSPSNASLDEINVNDIYFLYNNPTVISTYAVKSAEIAPKAEFVSLEDGILTVKVDINTEYVEEEGGDKIDQLMLVVPLKNGSEVNSDWAKVVSSGISYEDLALVRVPKPEDNSWYDMELAKTAADAKDLELDDPTVVQLTYDEELDLKEVVNTMLKSGYYDFAVAQNGYDDWSDFNIDTYNLQYVFDLKDEEGNTIVYKVGANNTDQQKFINLVGSKVTTRVYDLDGPNPAAVDRTPIVHVMLKSKDATAYPCTIVEGFIKLNIVEEKVVHVDPITINGVFVAGCIDDTLRVGTQQMNEEFYAKAGVSKSFFHENYVWAEDTDPDGVGTIQEVEDPLDNQSYNLIWVVTEAELWDNLGETITKTGTYTYGTNVIKVTFSATVTQPSINLRSLLISNYWDANKTFTTHNVAVPALDAVNPDDCTYENNINNSFKTTDEGLLDLAAINPAYANYSYEYIFDEDQPIETVDGITISVSDNGKELIATKGEAVETVAKITDHTDTSVDILSYNDESDLGKYLLNKAPEFMQARLKLVVLNECEREVIVKAFNGGTSDTFLVHFLRPVNVAAQAADNFIDGVDFGDEGSMLDMKDVVVLSDWRNYAKNTTAYNFDPDHENYYQYYGVEAVVADLDNITTEGLLVDGEELTELPSTIQVDQVTGGDFGVLTYKNNGSGLNDEFKLVVPVTVTYKWGEVVTTVKVTVKPTSAQ
jgi:hypothetical protein